MMAVPPKGRGSCTVVMVATKKTLFVVFGASERSIRRGDLDLFFVSENGRAARALPFRTVFGS